MSCTLPSRCGGAKPSRYCPCSSSATCANASARSSPGLNFDVAAAGLLGDSREARIREIVHDRRAQAAGAEARRPALPAPAVHADRVDHHVLVTRAIDDLSLARRVLLDAGLPSPRAAPPGDRPRILAVAQDEDRAAVVPALRPKASIAWSSAFQSGVGASGGIASGSAAASARASCVNSSLIVTSRPKLPTRAKSSGRSWANSVAGRLAQDRQVALHAAGDVEHHDEPDRLRRVVEDDDRLRLALDRGSRSRPGRASSPAVRHGR